MTPNNAAKRELRLSHTLENVCVCDTSEVRLTASADSSNLGSVIIPCPVLNWKLTTRFSGDFPILNVQIFHSVFNTNLTEHGLLPAAFVRSCSRGVNFTCAKFLSFASMRIFSSK